MVTITELKKQQAMLMSKKKEAQKIAKIQLEKINLKKSIRQLQRTPSQLRNIELAKRTGRGLRVLGKGAGKLISKQANRLAEQEVKRRKSNTKKFKSATTIKGLRKPKINNSGNPFANLDF